jgi:hypothetical protein
MCESVGCLSTAASTAAALAASAAAAGWLSAGGSPISAPGGADTSKPAGMDATVGAKSLTGASAARPRREKGEIATPGTLRVMRAAAMSKMRGFIAR